ncbi:MAG: histidinol dehydrogenase [Thermoleophilaceae bacterium]
MRVVTLGSEATPEQVRGLVPKASDVEAPVREIVADVRQRGDAALRELTKRFDGIEVDDLRVPEADLDDVEPELRQAMKLAAENVRTVADAGLREPYEAGLEQGQRVEIRELPVRRAAAYVPGGRAPYPSTVIMCAVTARAAGVEELAVCAPNAHPAVLAACAVCGIGEVYRVGGAQAIAALAYGTETIRPVDVIVGPGNRYVTEAKRQVAGDVGIDGLAGPSELVVVASEGADPELVALDLCAQAEHGEDSLVCVITPDEDILRRVLGSVQLIAGSFESVANAPLAAVLAWDSERAVRLANAIAPEHLQLMGEEAESLGGLVTQAGCLFVGRDAATAFGDYVAGSNHVLPTGGAARFQSALSPATFRRRMARVSLPPGAAARLAPAGAALARAEGFPVHGESMERRA